MNSAPTNQAPTAPAPTTPAPTKPGADKTRRRQNPAPPNLDRFIGNNQWSLRFNPNQSRNCTAPSTSAPILYRI